MREGGQITKWFVLAAVLILVCVYVYDTQKNKPKTAADVREIIDEIALAVGDDVGELQLADMKKIERLVGKFSGMEPVVIRTGIRGIENPTVAQTVAVELVLIRIYEQRPANLQSHILGEPWEVSGNLSQMTAFEIDRNAQGASLESMLDAYDGLQPRETWR